MIVRDVYVHLLDTGKKRGASGIEEIPDLLPTRFRGVPRREPEEPLLVPWLRIIADGGLEGWFFGSETLQTMAVAWCTQLATYWSGFLIGQDPLRREYLWQRSHRIVRFHTPGGPPYSDFIMAIDIALWDLAGKAAGMSVAQLLGQWRDKVPAYHRAGNLAPDAAVAEALDAKQKGYFGYKDHSYRGPKGNIEVAEALRAAVGPDWLLMHDPVEQYDYPEALYVGRELERLNYHWLEEPFRDWDLGRLKKLTDDLDLPILAGETLLGGIYSSAQYIQAGACDILRNSRIKGGITGMIKLAHLAEAHGLNAEPVSEGPCFGFAYLQVDAATSNAEFFETSDEALADHAENALAIGIQNPPQAVDGFVSVPDGPGLGIDLDRDRAEDATIEVY